MMGGMAVATEKQLEVHDPEVVGDRIKRIREAWRMSQTELGEICGVKKNTVSHWENGRQRPTVAQMYLLCQATGLTLDWIYLGRDGGLPLDVARRLTLL